MSLPLSKTFGRQKIFKSVPKKKGIYFQWIKRKDSEQLTENKVVFIVNSGAHIKKRERRLKLNIFLFSPAQENFNIRYSVVFFWSKQLFPWENFQAENSFERGSSLTNMSSKEFNEIIISKPKNFFVATKCIRKFVDKLYFRDETRNLFVRDSKLDFIGEKEKFI